MRRLRVSIALYLFFGLAVLTYKPARNIALSVFRLPLSAAESFVKTLLDLSRLSSLSRENSQLRFRLASSELERVRLYETLKSFSNSNRLLSFFSKTPGVTCSVIGRSIIPSQHIIVLNKGRKEGITKDSVVVDIEGLIGRVVESSGNSSMVMLLTDQNSRIAGIMEKSRELGLVVGTGGGMCRMIYIDLDAELEVGDKVLTAGMDGIFPKSVPIGAITKVIKNDKASYLEAYVKPSVRTSRIEEVLCLFPSS